MHGRVDRGSLNLEMALIIAVGVLLLPLLIIPLLALLNLLIAWGAGMGVIAPAAEASWFGLWLPLGVLIAFAVSAGVSFLTSSPLRGLYGKLSKAHPEPVSDEDAVKSAKSTGLGIVFSMAFWIASIAAVGYFSALYANGHVTDAGGNFFGALVRIIVPLLVVYFVTAAVTVRQQILGSAAKEAAEKAAKDAAGPAAEGEPAKAAESESDMAK